MKKILFFMMIMMCTLALGSAYAGGVRTGESDELYNGVTDFSGFKMEAPGNAGTKDASDEALYNGVTDFSRFKIGAPVKSRSVEAAKVAGLRGSDKELYNGITDFSG